MPLPSPISRKAWQQRVDALNARRQRYANRASGNTGEHGSDVTGPLSRLMVALQDFNVLRDEYQLETADRVVEGLGRMRERCSAVRQDVLNEEGTSTLSESCRQIADAASRMQLYVTLPPGAVAWEALPPVALPALAEFRVRVAEEAQTILEATSLDSAAHLVDLIEYDREPEFPW